MGPFGGEGSANNRLEGMQSRAEGIGKLGTQTQGIRLSTSPTLDQH